MKSLKYILIPLFLVSLSACVSSGKYEEAVAEADSVRNSLGKTQAEMDAMRKSLGNTQKELSASQAEIATLRKIEAETKRRNEIYAQFVSRLKSMRSTSSCSTMKAGRSAVQAR